MLTADEIDKLSSKAWLAPHELSQALNTIRALQQANAEQAELLRRALNQLDAYRERVKFYRNATTKLIG